MNRISLSESLTTIVVVFKLKRGKKEENRNADFLGRHAGILIQKIG